MKFIRNIGFGIVMMFLALHFTCLHAQTDTVCFNDTILYRLPALDDSEYEWTIGGGSVIYSSYHRDSVIVVWNEATGLYSIEAVRVNQNLCASVPEKLEVFVEIPTLELGEDRTICQGSSNLIFAEPGFEEYLWNFQPGTNEYLITTEGMLTLEVLDKFGCRATDSIYISEESVPVANFTLMPDETTLNTEVSFINRSAGAITFLWEFGDGETSELFEPVHSYTSGGEFDVSLSVWSESGCFDSLLLSNAVAVSQDCRILFPKGFIPDKNGPGDGFYDPSQRIDDNEIFHPIFENIDALEIKIYNRWGELVFMSSDPGKGWDGYYNGKLAQQDTYIYTAKARCVTGGEISSTGSVTLIY